MTTLTARQGGVPAGTYQLRFESVEDTFHDVYGEGLKWRFSVVGGEYHGTEVARVTKPTPTPKNSCGKMLAAITGQSVVPDKDYELDPFFGQVYAGQVEATANGMRVGTVARSDA